MSGGAEHAVDAGPGQREHQPLQQLVRLAIAAGMPPTP